jgi:hypothetical protein
MPRSYTAAGPVFLRSLQAWLPAVKKTRHPAKNRVVRKTVRLLVAASVEPLGCCSVLVRVS